MRTIERGNYSYARVGFSKVLPATKPGPHFYVQAAEWVADKTDQAVAGLMPGRLYRRWTFPGYPIPILEDTTFRGVTFTQANPHTDGVFLVQPGVRVVFEDCPLMNVTVPDGAEIIGGNPSHGSFEATGNPARPEIRLLCLCQKCAAARAELDEGAKAGTLERDELGRILHHRMKERFRARRAGPKAAEDLAAQAASNEAARAKGRAA